MNELALFAGAGGGILGGKLLGWRTVCAVEIDPYCREVLLRRQEDGSLGPFPVWNDVRTFDGKPWRDKVDIVTAGFPCQPFSLAGKQRGEDDERNMWPETARILSEVRPRFALLENVPGLLCTPYWGTILGDLASIGYGVKWDCVPASSVGAHHQRYRVFAVVKSADSDSVRSQGVGSSSKELWSGEQFEGLVQSELRISIPAGSSSGISDGLAYRLDRLKALGNGQVPAVARTAWSKLT